jgi:predicted enzyme related to lactoylglutathione lyase
MINIKDTNLTIMVKNMDEAIKFYETIGLKLVNRWGDHYAQVATKGIVVGLHPASGETKPSSSISIGFMVDDLEETKQHLSENKIVFALFDDKAGLYANLNDPDGTAIYFMQPLIKW